MASLPNKTLCSDGEIACINFMTPFDVQKYVEFLMRQNLIYKDDNENLIDIVVVDQRQGMTRDCDWAGFGSMDWNNNPEQPVSVCYFISTKDERLVVPEGWDYDNSLTANHKFIGDDVIPENFTFCVGKAISMYSGIKIQSKSSIYVEYDFQ